jgi:hypothetical protein
MAVTKADFIEIAARHGIAEQLAVAAYDAYAGKLAGYVSGISDEDAKRDINVMFMMMAEKRGAAQQPAEQKRKGFFSKLRKK